MSEEEKELIELIRNSEHPELAIAKAVEIIRDYLKQLESLQAPPSDDREESA